MLKTAVETEKAPKAIGPYVQAIKTDHLIYTSGQIALTAEGRLEADTIKAQTEQVMQNLDAVLQAAGSSLAKIIKTTCFLSDMDNFAEFNEVYQAHFSTTSFPARSCVEVSRLPKDVLVEVEAIAAR